MEKTVQQFINQYTNKAVDYDGAYGVQCVDAFKVFCAWAKYPVKATGNGWADGYWHNRLSNGYAHYFNFITDKKSLQGGDWLFWKYGSKSSPLSHVAMFVKYANIAKTKAYVFGQNQRGLNGNRAFCTVVVDLDILGAYRPKMWLKKENTPTTPTVPTKQVVATGKATAFSTKIARTYTCTANLNLRNSGSISAKILTTMKKGQKVTCFGYYTRQGSVNWLYVQALIGKTLYTGFCSSDYLK